jgi:hypothetical protein
LGAGAAGFAVSAAAADFVTSAIFFSAGFGVFFIGLAFLFCVFGFIGF